MNKNRIKKLCIISVFVAAIMYVAVFKTNVFEKFSNIDEYIGNSTIYDENQLAYVITLKYMYQNGTMADSKDVYVFDKDENINIQIPQHDGYTSSINEINETIDEDFLDRIGNLDYVEITKQEDTNVYRIYYTITYIPAPSSYKIAHYLQNVDGSYSVVYQETISDNVFIGDIVSTEIKEYYGYTFNRNNSIVESSVNKDGTTELSLYYDRNVSHIYLDSNGGTYFDPISQIYGQNIDLSYFIPERSGYIFRGWECIDRENGNVVDTPSSMPNNDLYFRAKWDISTSSFTITYMVENADNDEYSNAGMYTVRNIETESSVSDIRNLEDIIAQGFETIKGDKKDYFEYNDALSSTNFDVEVLGDSTTNINVYYDRKEYTLRFMAGRAQEAQWWWQDDEYQIATATGGSESACSWTTVSSPATITKNGSTYENDEYTITAKYEGYISSLWPTVSDVSNTKNGNTTYYFVSWGTSSNSGYWANHTNHNVLGLYPTMSEDLIIDPNDTSQEHVLYGYWSTGPRYFRYHYMYEAFDQKTDTGISYTGSSGINKFYEEDSTTIVRTTNTASGQNGPSFYGYELVGKTYTSNNGGSESNPTDIYFYYDRDEYDITLFNVNGQYVPSQVSEELNRQGIYVSDDRLYAKHGADISALENLYEEWQKDLSNEFKYPLITSETKNREFGGWYLDISQTIPMNWNSTSNTIISSNLTLYANWKIPTFDVSFNVNNGTWTDTDSSYTHEDGMYKLNVSSGSTLKVPKEPTRDGYTFKGWYYKDKEGNYVEYLFSASQKVYDDIMLEANWEAKEEGSYTVKYILAEYRNNGELITNINEYSNITYLAPDKKVENIKYGTVITESAISIEVNGNRMYFSDEYEKSITLSTNENENVIYFFYTPEPNVSYTVYYLIDTGRRYDNGEVPNEEEMLAPSQIKTIYDTSTLEVIEDSIEIDGYEVDAFKKSTFIEIDSKNPSSTRNAIYFYYSPVERQGEYEVNFYFMKEDGSYSLVPDYTNQGQDSVGKYIYVTDYYNYLPESSELYIGHEFDAEKTGALMAIITSSKKAVLNLYFKNSIYNIEYDTRGGDFTDTSGIYTQVTDEKFSTQVSYNGLAPKPTDPVKANNRFLGWYDKATDELYDFNSKVTKDVELYAKWMEQRDIVIRKEWNDNDNQDGLRPDSVDIKIMNGTDVVDTVTLKESEDWSKIVRNLDVYDSLGNEINYTLEENQVNGYTVEYSYEDIYKVKNTHVPQTKVINISKVWQDNNDQDGIRPENIELSLRVNSNLYTKITLNEGNSWNADIEVPVYQNGKLANYTIDETYVSGYEMSYTYNENSIVVTNTHVPETKSITIEKIWQDNNNQDGIRPKSIEVNIKNGNEVLKTVTITDENWIQVVNDLPVYSNGKKIEYTLEEVEVSGYTSSYTNSEDNYVLTNVHVPETKSIKITKIWNDNENQDGIRPDSINVVLNADNSLVQNIELSVDNSWQTIVEDLPVYKNGVKINYTVDEEKTSDYTTTVENTEDGFNVINTHEVKKTTLSVEKIWNDNENQDGKRPQAVKVYLMANGEVADEVTLSDENSWRYDWQSIDMYQNGSAINYTVQEENVSDYTVQMSYDENSRLWTITNTHIPEKKSISVTKIWDDNNDQDGKRPENLVISLTSDNQAISEVILSEENGWQASFDNLDVYKNGTVIDYQVTEPEVPEYTTNVQVQGDNYVFTNTHIPERSDRVVKKVWRDGSNKENTRPNSISFRLLKNGEYFSDVITLTKENMVDNFDEWEYTFDDLFVYENGEKINYTVEEIEVPSGYSVIYNQENLTMYNAYPPELEVSVEKVWQDDNNADGIRPESVFVQLYADGKPYEVDGQNIGYVELNEENNWKYTWGFIEKYNSNGEKYNYTLEEVNVGDDRYSTNIDVKDEENPEFQFTYIVTNSYTPQKTSKTVTKVWDDNNNQDGLRPSEVTVHLLANGNEVASTKLSAENNWTYTFENINLKENGQDIEYSVIEDNVNGYTQNIEYNNVDTFTITNTHIPETKNITIEKIWNDNENQDGLRPDTIEVTLKADGEVKGTFNIDNNTWKTSVENLDVYSSGKEILYTIEEKVVDGYSVEYQTDGNIYKIINTHEPEKRNITVEKVWQDDNNRDGVRPANIVLTLKNGEEIIRDNIILNRSNNWTTVIDNLDKYQDGQEISYNLVEENIDSYSTEYNYDLDNNKITIINTHLPQLKTIKIAKVWNDEENIYGKRPSSLDVDIYANQTLVQTVTLEESSNWEINVGGLYQKENGKDIQYTIVERENEYYTNSIEYSLNDIVLTNNIKTYDIKTKVNGIGGTISGQDLNYYERVAYKDSTQKDIIITPNIGYKISKIIVNGIEQELPEDVTSKYIMDKFTEVVENIDIIVEFEKIEYGITTEVINENGTISGENENPYELVKYGENSIKDIVITPNYGYEISSIKINEQEIELPEDPTLPYTLDKFINVTENKHVSVEFKKTEAKVVVSYETKNGKKLIDDVVIEGFIGDSYITEEKLFDNYVLVVYPDNFKGTMDNTIINVKYIYEYRPNIIISKIVKGNYAEVDKKFEFSINILDNDTNYSKDIKYNITNVNGDIVSEGKIVNGQANIYIGHNEKATLYEIPEDLTYTITELEAKDYTTYINNEISNSKSITGILNNNTQIEFVNEKEYISPTGIMLNVLPFAIGIIIVVLLIILIAKFKKNNKQYR